MQGVAGFRWTAQTVIGRRHLSHALKPFRIQGPADCDSPAICRGHWGELIESVAAVVWAIGLIASRWDVENGTRGQMRSFL
jgi:hypothetical protein